MAFDVDAKIKELVNKEGKLIAEIDSLQRDGYWKEANKKSKELEKVRQELLKYRNLKSMMNKDTAEILRLSGLTVDANEQWITMNGAHIKIEEGESKASAAKRFISSKEKGSKNLENKSGRETQKINKSSLTSEGDLTEEEVKKVREKFSKIDEPTSLTGSEYGEYISMMESKLRKAGKYPDLSEYDKINDKMIDLREKGKKDTEEYRTLEKQRKDWNKNFNKINKEIEKKAYNLSSEKEKKRLDEIHEFFQKNPSKMEAGEAKDGYNFEDPKVIEEAIRKVEQSGHPDPYYLAGLKRALYLAKKERGLIKDDDATEEGAIQKYGEEKGKFEDSCGEKIFTKGTEDEKYEIIYETGKWPYEVKSYKEVFNAPYEQAKKMAERKKKGDYYRVIQVTQLHDKSESKDSATQLECKEILKLSGIPVD